MVEVSLVRESRYGGCSTRGYEDRKGAGFFSSDVAVSYLAKAPSGAANHGGLQSLVDIWPNASPPNVITKEVLRFGW